MRYEYSNCFQYSQHLLNWTHCLHLETANFLYFSKDIMSVLDTIKNFDYVNILLLFLFLVTSVIVIL